MSEVVILGEERSDRSGSSHDWTAVDAVRSVLADLESGKLEASGIMIVPVLKSEGDFQVGRISAMLKVTDMIAACEILKTRMLRHLGEIP